MGGSGGNGAGEVSRHVRKDVPYGHESNCNRVITGFFLL